MWSRSQSFNFSLLSFPASVFRHRAGIFIIPDICGAIKRDSVLCINPSGIVGDTVNGKFYTPTQTAAAVRPFDQNSPSGKKVGKAALPGLVQS